MIEAPSHALGTSLVFARMGGPAMTPPSEQQLLERLQGAASDAGCRAPDVVTAVYVGLKIHLRVCVCGPARAHAMALFNAIVSTLVGVDSEQTLHLRGPITDDAVAQRYAALRLHDFVTAVLEPSAQGKVWFLLIDTPGAPTPMLEWIEREYAATLRAAGQSARALPPNLFILVAANERPRLHEQRHSCWLALDTPPWDEGCAHTQPSVPPVGYQRQLLDNQLTGASYRRRLRRTGLNTRGKNGAQHPLQARWLAASVDRHGAGLWQPDDPAANMQKALAVLHAQHDQ